MILRSFRVFQDKLTLLNDETVAVRFFSKCEFRNLSTNNKKHTKNTCYRIFPRLDIISQVTVSYIYVSLYFMINKKISVILKTVSLFHRTKEEGQQPRFPGVSGEGQGIERMRQHMEQSTIALLGLEEIMVSAIEVVSNRKNGHN